MSTSLVFFSFGSTLLRIHRNSLSSSTLRVTKPFFYTPAPVDKLCTSLSVFSTATALETTSSAANEPRFSSEQQVQQYHPWPEWVAFVDQLKSKGYLTDKMASPVVPKNSSSVDAENSENDLVIDVGLARESVYKDMHVLKDACLSFARDRFDIFKSLSQDDIQAVVEGGCPNIFRKVVNSAKRLRVYTGLDEAEVCSDCNLRKSCDRAYVLLKESEATSKTLDIVRILLFYALDQSVISEATTVPCREEVEMSARRLLSELIDLSEEPLDPELENPSFYTSRQKQLAETSEDKASQSNNEKRVGDWACPKCNFMNFSRNVLCKKCNEARQLKVPDGSGRQPDWICTECNFLNFSRNAKCLKCKADGPKMEKKSDGEFKEGDWVCPQCCFLNYKSRHQCLKCNEAGPIKVVNRPAMKKGDWICPECDFMNYAGNSKCFRCPQPRPPRALNPGDWECPSCKFLNYRRNSVCLKCNCDPPKESTQRCGDDEWSRP